MPGDGDGERIRWYLEDYAEFPAHPAPEIARDAETRLAQTGADLFRHVFAGTDAAGIWERARDRLGDARIEIEADPEAGPGLAWELLRDPDRDAPLALGAKAFVRTHLRAAQRAVLLHAYAGAGKSSTAAEFARWYQSTGGLGQGAVLWSSFEHHLSAERAIDTAGDRFAGLLEANGIAWQTITDPRQRRDLATQILAQIPVLWVWDNVEPVTGFPAGTPSAWTQAEQDDLVKLLRDLTQRTRCKVLLTSRREEDAWLGDLVARVWLPRMPLQESLQLAAALAARRGAGKAGTDWRPLLHYAAGNPLTITILVGQALRESLISSTEVEDFVARLKAGEARLEADEDAALGRTRSLAASLDYGVVVNDIGRILLRQEDPGCLPFFQEALELTRKIDDHTAEAQAAGNLGAAYLTVPGLRNLAEAERWLTNSLRLRPESDRHGRALNLGHLGTVALEQFDEATAAGEGEAVLLEHLDTALRYYEQALNLTPDDDHETRGSMENQLGNVDSRAGRIDQALLHYQRSIRHEEARGNVYTAGQTRYNISTLLARNGRFGDAMHYARAALDNFRQVGAGAADKVDLTERLIADLETLRRVGLPPGRRAASRPQSGCGYWSTPRQGSSPDAEAFVRTLHASGQPDLREPAGTGCGCCW